MTKQLFESAKEYAAVCFVYVIITLMELYEAIIGSHPMHQESFRLNKYLLGLVTLAVFAFLFGLLRKTAVKTEIAGIILTLILVIVELTELLPRFGVGWVNIPHRQIVLLLICTTAAIVALVRTFDVFRKSRPQAGGPPSF